MKSRKISQRETRELIERLNKINADIHEQMPSPPNRFEGYESFPADEKISLQERSNLLDNKVKQLYQASFAQYVSEELADSCQLFLSENKLQITKPLSALEKERLSTFISQNIPVISSRIVRRFEHTGLQAMDESKLIPLLNQQLPTIVEKICNGEKCYDGGEEFQERIKQSTQLAALRIRLQKQLNANNQLVLLDTLEPDTIKAINKAKILWRGLFWDENKARVGHCDEYASLGLKRILETYIKAETPILSIEKISIPKAHTFLVLNRDLTSPLKNMKEWGESAIIFDPWNNLCCKANELEQQPLQYLSFETDRDWNSIVFDPIDRCMLSRLRDSDYYFDIAGNIDFNLRAQRVKEEYQLISLQSEQFKSTRDFIASLLKECWPDNLNIDLDVYLTTGSDKLITTIPGLAKPSIAIHYSLFSNLEKLSLAELKFALSRTLQEVKWFGCGVSNHIEHIDNVKMDLDVLKTQSNGDAAIAYLRRSINFAEHEAVKTMKPSTLVYDSAEPNVKKALEARIKNIMTYLAKRGNIANPPLVQFPESVIAEINQITAQRFYSHGFDQCASKVEKIHYLTSCLPDLKNELLPYEFILTGSVRVREFCSLIEKIDIDLNNPELAKAVDALINKALELRIPAFERIYLTVVNQTIDLSNSTPNLQPIGAFKQLQQWINVFVNASTYNEAQEAAEHFINLYDKLADHFPRKNRFGSAIEHLNNYKKINPNSLPHNSQRFLASNIGDYIVWQGFNRPFIPPRNHETRDLQRQEFEMNLEKSTHPWIAHLRWAEENHSRAIADMLWRMGLNTIPRMFNLYPEEELAARLENVFYAIVSLSGEVGDDFNLYKGVSSKLLRFLSDKHIVKKDMFANTHLSFDEAYRQYYDANYAQLCCPGRIDGVNVDNSSVRFLLAKFVEVILHGTAEEKQQVKRFFLGRADEKDLFHLSKAYPNIPCTSYLANTLYSDFVLEQQFEGVAFDLFSADEVLEIIDKLALTHHQITWQQYVRIFKLPYKRLSLDFLEAIFPLIETQQRMWYNVKFFKQYIEENKAVNVLSNDAIRLVKLTYEWSPAYNYNVLKSFNWVLPQTPAEIAAINCHDLIFQFRQCDLTMAFPDYHEQVKFTKLVQQVISAIKDIDERIKALEELLLVDNVIMPLTDVPLITWAIDAWVNAVFAKYGTDDNTPGYYSLIVPVIDRICEGGSKRDVTNILSKLADRIQSQWKVSEHIGIFVDPERFLQQNNRSVEIAALSQLGGITSLLGNNKKDLTQFLDFISSPLSESAISTYAAYIINHDLAKKLYEKCGYIHWFDLSTEEKTHVVEMILHQVHQGFWCRPLQQRAILLDYCIIPSSCVATDAEMTHAHDQGFEYIANKLFPQAKIANSDDEFAYQFLLAYLEASDKDVRSILLAGLLVASNECSSSGNNLSVGKKLAMLCEHMGPAYIKLAQAIHSYPGTPEHIRRDLGNIKSKASPPYRWTAWRMIMETLSPEDKNSIVRLEARLGSASYRYAYVVRDGEKHQLVLSQLRENAEVDAERGFEHIRKALLLCKHPRMKELLPSALDMLDEAKLLSQVEMNKEMSEAQYDIAEKTYHNKIEVDGHTVITFPTKLLKSGNQYRLLSLMNGEEFNDLPAVTEEDKVLRTTIAKAVLIQELTRILSGEFVDSDRHGNQFRAVKRQKTVYLGLYDFGELNTTKPTEQEMGQLAQVLKDISVFSLRSMSFSSALEKILSDHIAKYRAQNQSTRFLMHVRKALLALQDFQKHLTLADSVEVLSFVAQSEYVHPLVKEALGSNIHLLNMANLFFHAQSKLLSPLSFWKNGLSNEIHFYKEENSAEPTLSMKQNN